MQLMNELVEKTIDNLIVDNQNGEKIIRVNKCLIGCLEVILRTKIRLTPYEKFMFIKDSSIGQLLGEIVITLNTPRIRLFGKDYNNTLSDFLYIELSKLDYNTIEKLWFKYLT